MYRLYYRDHLGEKQHKDFKTEAKAERKKRKMAKRYQERYMSIVEVK